MNLTQFFRLELLGVAALLICGESSGSLLPLPVRQHRLFQEALRQAQSPTMDWDPAQRDCAGFVRYLYRRAMGTSSPRWKTVQGEESLYASAADLVGWNFKPLGRDLSRVALQTGDVLAFRKALQAPGEDWHLMVILKAPPGVEARELVVYHNGAQGSGAGVRKLWLQALLERERQEWSARAENPRFVGVFRHPEWFGPEGKMNAHD